MSVCNKPSQWADRAVDGPLDIQASALGTPAVGVEVDEPGGRMGEYYLQLI